MMDFFSCNRSAVGSAAQFLSIKNCYTRIKNCYTRIKNCYTRIKNCYTRIKNY